MATGIYICGICKCPVPEKVPAVDKHGDPIFDAKGKLKTENNIFVDHIDPVIDPAKGFEGWDKLIERMFCEREGFQLACGPCHTTKTAEERAIRTARQRREKEEAKK